MFGAKFAIARHRAAPHAVVTAVAGAIYLAGGDTRALAADRDAVARLVRGVREAP
jgi:hypothetical protein